MKTYFMFFPIIIILVSCKSNMNKDNIIRDIVATEKAFEQMAKEKSVAEAFSYFAADSAVILRGSQLIKGKDNIHSYYSQEGYLNVSVTWTPDCVEVSDCGTMAYTYGKYLWVKANHLGEKEESTGYFHTVWEKQPDNSWRHVWD